MTQEEAYSSLSAVYPLQGNLFIQFIDYVWLHAKCSIKLYKAKM